MISKLLLRFALGPSFLESIDHDNPISSADKSNRKKSEKIAEAQTSILEFIGLGDSKGRRKTNQAGDRRFLRQIRRRSAGGGTGMGAGGMALPGGGLGMMGMGNGQFNEEVIEVDILTAMAMADAIDDNGSYVDSEDDDAARDEAAREYFDMVGDESGQSVRESDDEFYLHPRISGNGTSSPNRINADTIPAITPSTVFIPLSTLLLDQQVLDSVVDKSKYMLTSQTEYSSNWLVFSILNPAVLSVYYHTSYFFICWPLSAIRSLTAVYDISFTDALKYKCTFPWTVYRNPWDTLLVMFGFDTVKSVGQSMKHYSNKYLFPMIFSEETIKMADRTTNSVGQEISSIDGLRQVAEEDFNDEEESSRYRHNKKSLILFQIAEFLLNDVLIDSLSTFVAYPFYQLYITNVLDLSHSAPTVFEMYTPLFYSDNMSLITTLITCRFVEALGNRIVTYALSKFTLELERSFIWGEFLFLDADPRILESGVNAESKLSKSISTIKELISSFVGEMICLPFGIYTLRLFATKYSPRLPIAKTYMRPSLAYAITFEWATSWFLAQGLKRLVMCSPLIALARLVKER